MHRRNNLVIWNRILGFVTVLFVSSQGIADIAHDAHGSLSTHLKGLDRVLLEFEQYDVSQQLIQRGRLYLVQPGQFRMETDPASVLVVSDGTDVFEVDYLLEQVTVYSLNDEVRTSPLGLFLAPAEALLEYEVVEGIGATSDAYAVPAAGMMRRQARRLLQSKRLCCFPTRTISMSPELTFDLRMGWPAALDIAVAGGGSMRFLFVGHSELTTIDPDWFLAPSVGPLEVIDHRSPTASDAANE